MTRDEQQLHEQRIGELLRIQREEPLMPEIKPVERDCCCIPANGRHSFECNESYRNKFFSLWRAVRSEFYSRG